VGDESARCHGGKRRSRFSGFPQETACSAWRGCWILRAHEFPLWRWSCKVSVEETSNSFVPRRSWRRTWCPCPRYSTVGGEIPLPDLLPKERIEAIVERNAAKAAPKIVNLLKTGLCLLRRLPAAAVEMGWEAISQRQGKKILPCRRLSRWEEYWNQRTIRWRARGSSAPRGVLKEIIQIKLLTPRKEKRPSTAKNRYGVGAGELGHGFLGFVVARHGGIAGLAMKRKRCMMLLTVGLSLAAAWAVSTCAKPIPNKGNSVPR